MKLLHYVWHIPVWMADSRECVCKAIELELKDIKQLRDNQLLSIQKCAKQN